MPIDKRKLLGNLDLVIAVVSLVILIVVTFGGVIMRYFINAPLVWAEEVQLWTFLWMTFFGGGAAFRYGIHVAVEMVVDHRVCGCPDRSLRAWLSVLAWGRHHQTHAEDRQEHQYFACSVLVYKRSFALRQCPYGCKCRQLSYS